MKLNRRCFRMAVLALSAGIVAAEARESSWTSVQSESSLEFITTFEGADAPGKFNHFKVDLNLDPAKLAESFLLVQVDTTSASFGSGDIDAEIAQTDWFDAKTYPSAEFKSDRILHAEGTNYVAEGMISIKGVSKPLSVPLRWSRTGQDATLAGELTLSRLDFGIGSGTWATNPLIGFDVRVRFKVHMTIRP
jgi:polyisoprenoid-binding protein YceI